MEYQSKKTILIFLDGRTITNIHIRRQDALTAEQIFGQDIGCVKGKTTRSKPSLVKVIPYTIPRELMTKRKHVTITGDIFSVDRTLFYVTHSRTIKFFSI